MEYKNYQLSNICKYRKEKIVTTKVKKEEYISTENMLANKQGIEESKSLPQSKSINRFEEKDILISNIRPYFKKIWFSTMMGGASPDVLIIEADQSKVTPEFLYYLLSQEDFFNFMVQTSKGTKMPRGDKDAIMQYKVKLFNKEKQREIVNILSSIDEKVQNNKLIISNLEQLSQNLFKHWFIDFEFPNEEGKPYKSSGGEMVESELGKLPKGWSIKSLDEIAKFQNGLAMQKFRPEENAGSLPVLKIKELNQGNTTLNSERCSLDIKKEVKVFDGDVIFSWSGTLLVKLWTGGAAGLNQHLFKVTSEKYEKWFYYLWTKHYLKIFQARAAEKATTMGHIKRSHLNDAKINLPPEEILTRAADLIQPIIEKIVVLGIENKNLTQLRDTLLPKLLSGEIEIPDDLEV